MDRQENSQKLGSRVKSGWVVFGLLSCGCLTAIGWPMLLLSRPHHHPAGYDRLMAAINDKNPREVELILKSGVNPNVFPQDMIDLRDEDDISALNSAAQDGSSEMVGILLDHGADPNLGDGWHASPLSAATETESLDTMELLLKRGATLNKRDATGSALYRAGVDGKEKSVRFLLNHGATTTPGFIKICKDLNISSSIIEMLETSLKQPKIEHSDK